MTNGGGGGDNDDDDDNDDDYDNDLVIQRSVKINYWFLQDEKSNLHILYVKSFHCY